MKNIINPERSQCSITGISNIFYRGNKYIYTDSLNIGSVISDGI